MIFLEVPFTEKEEVKKLGARWNPRTKKWYIPPAILAKKEEFARWLPVTTDDLSKISTNKNLDLTPSTEQNKAISLSELTSKVQLSLSQNIPKQIWIKSEIGNLTKNRGHYYLEMVESDNIGRQIALVRSMIWASDATNILNDFKNATGNNLEIGQSILFLAEVNFHAKFGFSLTIKDIDPSFTLGKLEIHLAKIRKQLIEEGIYSLNKELSLPSDFFRIAIISPPDAAGLGDFRTDANILQELNLCEFHYLHSAFQGENIIQEMQASFEAFNSLHLSNPFDALVIIRGGGSKLDLSQLNQYEIAKQICEVNIPVITGIGHEKDNTLLDEVSSKRFDTPSKVISHIKQVIFNQAQNAKVNWLKLENTSSNLLNEYQNRIVKYEQIINSCSNRFLEKWRHETLIVKEQIKQQAKQRIQSIEHDLQMNIQRIQTNSQRTILLKLQEINHRLKIVHVFSSSVIKEQRQQIQQWMKFILASGPQTQFKRGFVIAVNDTKRVITSVKNISNKQRLNLQFKDGKVITEVISVQAKSHTTN